MLDKPFCTCACDMKTVEGKTWMTTNDLTVSESEQEAAQERAASRGRRARAQEHHGNWQEQGRR